MPTGLSINFETEVCEHIVNLMRIMKAEGGLTSLSARAHDWPSRSENLRRNFQIKLKMFEMKHKHPTESL